MAPTKDKVKDMKPYVERALKDEDLRDNVMAAFAAAREVYDELIGGRDVKSTVARAATNKDVQENMKTALDELREAADRLQGKESHKGRNTTLLVAGIAIGILMNPVTGPGARRWIKDRVLGESDEFTYGGDSYGGSDGPASGSTASSGAEAFGSYESSTGGTSEETSTTPPSAA
jgi:hypothetical protein